MKGRIMLFVTSILTYQFSPTHLTPSAADQVGVASVYSHESGSGTASGQKLNRDLTRLWPEHRQVIDLVYYHDKSVAEVAQILDVPTYVLCPKEIGGVSQGGLRQVALDDMPAQ